MPNEDRIQEGIEAIQAGKLTVAFAIFAGVVKSDPASEQGWYWLGQCCPNPEQSQYCYRRVLALNPGNLEARHKLDRLTHPAPSPASPAPVPLAGSMNPLRTSSNTPDPASPSNYEEDETRNMAAPLIPTATERTVEQNGLRMELEQEAPASMPAPMTPQDFQAGPPNPKARPKRQARFLIWILPLLLLCGLGAALLFLNGVFNNFTPAAALQFIAPLPTLYHTPTPEISLTPPQATVTQPPPTQTASATSNPSPLPTIAYVPTFNNQTCSFDIPQGASVKCGEVIVPEDRTNPKSEMVKLAVAVFSSTSSNPEPDPVLFLQGGPGGAAVAMIAGAYKEIVEPFLSERDFIVFDQRGTGLSTPVMDCQELQQAYREDIQGQLPASGRKLIYSNAFLSCHGMMHMESMNLNAYSTEASAADVKDILTALGYQKVDLFGASYGTRLAQVVMRDYPGIVRSSVVDSVVPIEAKLFNEDPAAYDGDLQTLFDSCATDQTCHAAYPNLETDFWALVSKLDANPVSVTSPRLDGGGTLTENVDGSTLMSTVILGLLKNSIIAPVAQAIYQIKGGDYSSLIGAQSSLPNEFEGISPGLYIQVMCHEQLLATTADQLKIDIANHHEIGDFSRLPFFGTVDDMYQTCKNWGALPPAPGENDPVISDIPTLIITGKYDPTTPPMYAQQVASRLSHSFYFEFPNQGHTPTAADTSGCAMQTAVDFLDNPTVEPDRSCLNKMKDVQFLVPYTATPPLKLKKVDAAGISTIAPADWRPLGDGFYFRGDSPFDITQAGVFEVDGTSSSELVNWLSMKAYGYRGLDSAPAQAGQRQANGLKWTLYTSTSYGRPVDIAMADYRGRSVVILAFSDNDEHDAIYRTVFLPMVDGTVP